MISNERLIHKREFGVGPKSSFGGTLRFFETDEFIRIECQWPLADPAFDVPIPPYIIDVPRSYFTTSEQLQDWIEHVEGTFRAFWIRVMVVETNQHLRDCAYWTLGELKIAPVNFSDILEEHRKASLENVRYRLGLPVGRGHRSKWRKPELTAALFEIVRKKPALSWKEINEELESKYPGRAPKNGETLRVLASSHGLTLRFLKAQARKTKSESGQSIRHRQTAIDTDRHPERVTRRET